MSRRRKLRRDARRDWYSIKTTLFKMETKFDHDLFEAISKNVLDNWRKQKWTKQEGNIFHMLEIPPKYYAKEILEEYIRQINKRRKK